MTKRDKIITALAGLLGNHVALEFSREKYEAVADAILGIPRQPSPTEDKGCIPELRQKSADVTTVLDQLSHRTQKRWIELYKDEHWLRTELLKAAGWYQDFPQKSPRSPRGWAQALSSWLSRGWEFQRKRGGTGDDLAAVRAKYDDKGPGTLI